MGRNHDFKNREFPIIGPDVFLKILIRIIPIASQHGHDSHFQYMIQPFSPFIGPFV